MASASAVRDVYDYLLANGYAGGSADYALSERHLHDDQDRLVAVAEDGGPTAEVPASSGVGDEAVVDLGVLITFRGGQHEANANQDLAEDVRVALNGLFDVQIGSRTYMRVRAINPQPAWLGYDENARPMHTIALRLMKAAP